MFEGRVFETTTLRRPEYNPNLWFCSKLNTLNRKNDDNISLHLDQRFSTDRSRPGNGSWKIANGSWKIFKRVVG